eukprot:UN06737
MGCCFAGMVNNMMENAYAQQAQIAAQMSAAPRQMATGDTLIPMNYITGQYPSTYPGWFNQQQITPQTWTNFINQLNSVTMPLAAQSKQSTLKHVDKAMQPTLNVNTAMNRNLQYQSQQMATQQQLITTTDQILLQYNQQLFEKNGLQATSSYAQYMTMYNQAHSYGAGLPQQLGVIIKRIQQPQIVYVV